MFALPYGSKESIRNSLVVISVFLLLFCASPSVQAFVKHKSDKAKAPAKPVPRRVIPTKNTDDSSKPGAQKQFVKVELSVSRPEVTVEHAWGLTADISNVSSDPLQIFSTEVNLVMHPEATSGTQCILGNASFLPATTLKNKEGDPDIVLQPGEHYVFSWLGGTSTDARDDGSKEDRSNDCALRGWPGVKEGLNFLPGTYTFIVEGKVHPLTDKQCADQSSVPYHTFAEAVPVKLSIEQFSILKWAAFGSALAYLVVVLQDAGPFSKLVSLWGQWKAFGFASIDFIVKLLAASLLGAVLSVVAARLSDTQFPVKVSVNDLWGAMTIGFVLYFVGDKIIDKLKGPLKPKSAG